MSDRPAGTATEPARWPAERLLKVILRTSGSVAMLAVIPMFMPRSWIQIAHQGLGLGPFPAGPVPEYLARSASGLYVMLGGLWWVCAADIQRHRCVLLYTASVLVAFGIAISVIDHWLGLPVWWQLAEGSVNIAIGLLIILLLQRIASTPDAPADRFNSQHP